MSAPPPQGPGSLAAAQTCHVLRLAESEKKFQSEAYRALSEEAKVALQGNDHLQTVLSKQNGVCLAVPPRARVRVGASTGGGAPQVVWQQI